MRLPIIACVLFSVFATAWATTKTSASSASPYRPSTKTINHRAFELEGSVNYFQSTGYYDDSGAANSFNESSGFNKIDADGYIRYGVSEQLQIDIGARYRQNNSFNQTVDISTSGLESYTVGAKYSFDPIGRWIFAVELRYRQSAYTNEDLAPRTATPTDQLVLGDSGGEATVLGHFSWQQSKAIFISGYGGYRRPGNSLSPEFPWNLELAYAYTNWAFIGGIKGITSMGSSDYTDASDLKPVQATGETHLFNSINRAYTMPFVGINYAFNNWRLETSMGRVVSGVSTDQGNEFKIALTYNTGGNSLEEKKVEAFKEYQIEATVLKVSPRNTFVKIDQGTAHDIEKGMRFDIFKTDYYGGNEMVATGVVYELGATWAIIKVQKIYKDAPILKGYTARGR